MVSFLEPGDLAGFTNGDVSEDTIQAMIDDATALAVIIAPCIAEDDFAYVDAVKAILRGVLSRWSAAGAGGVQSYTAGPFITSFDTRSERKGMFWPSEIQQLQSLCDRAAGVGTTALTGTAAPVGRWEGPDLWKPYRP